jgi:hypothetical protein
LHQIQGQIPEETQLMRTKTTRATTAVNNSNQDTFDWVAIIFLPSAVDGMNERRTVEACASHAPIHQPADPLRPLFSLFIFLCY